MTQLRELKRINANAPGLAIGSSFVLPGLCGNLSADSGSPQSHTGTTNEPIAQPSGIRVIRFNLRNSRKKKLS
jgi:hypothetical protein